MRILWQGFTHPTLTGVYNDALVEHLNAVAREGTTLEFRGVVPPDRYIHRLTEWRCAIQAIGSALEAEQEGFDCVVLGHFQDAGLWEMRGALEVPVLGLGEGSMLYACQLGYRFGLVTIHPLFERWHEEQVQRYSLGERFAGVRSMQTSVELFVSAFGGDDEAADAIAAQFEEHAAALAAAGAEVVIPAGGFPALLMARRGVRQLGYRFGLVTIHPLFERWHEEQVQRYSLGERFAGVRSMQTSVELFVSAFGGDDDAADAIAAQFEEHAAALSAAGAEVVIPAGGFPALLMARRGVRELGDAVVLDANAVLVKLAEAAIDLRGLNGTATSRHSTFAKASPQALEEFRSVVGRLGA